MIDTKRVLREMFRRLADDSAAAAALGVTSSEGYAILGAELDESGKVVSACVDVPTLIDKIMETLEGAQEDYRRLVVETLDSRPLPPELRLPGRRVRPLAGSVTGRQARPLAGSVEIMLDPVDFALQLDDAYSSTLPLPSLRMHGTPDALVVKSPYGGTREYRHRCTSVHVDDLATVCLLKAGHQGDCDRIPILTSAGLVCGELFGDEYVSTYCRLHASHKPEQHYAVTQSGSYRW